jgi:hypothetical protein
MQIEEARGFVFQALREGDWNQWGSLLASVGMIKARAQRLSTTPTFGDGRQFLTETEKTLVMEVVWSLIVQGILIPGLNDSNQGWPFLRLTAYGQQCVKEDRILPHDPEGFLREFHREVPNADATIVEYLTESLQCYVHGLHRSAAVMLGGASEQAILLLIEAYGSAIGEVAAKQTFESAVQKATSIFRKYDVFEKHFSAHRARVPKPLIDNVDSLLRGIFDLIRNSRNDAGHPARGTPVGRDIVYSHLRLFTPYCKRISELIAWLVTNEV